MSQFTVSRLLTAWGQYLAGELTCKPRHVDLFKLSSSSMHGEKTSSAQDCRVPDSPVNLRRLWEGLGILYMILIKHGPPWPHGVQQKCTGVRELGRGKEGGGTGGDGRVRRMKMCPVHVPALHDKCGHDRLQAHTEKLERKKEKDGRVMWYMILLPELQVC